MAATSLVHREGSKIVKKVCNFLPYGIVEREVDMLVKLHHSGFTPEIHDCQGETITMEWVGDQLSKGNAPKNIGEQMVQILQYLRAREIRHNDIRPSNFTVLGEQLYLIDWQWATEKLLDPPEGWPQHLGGSYRAGWPEWIFDDGVSMERVLRTIRQ